MFIVLDFHSLFQSKVTGIPIYDGVILANQVVRFRDVGCIGCRCRDGMDIAAPCVHARMDFHPEMPLVAFLGRVHLGIASLFCVLRGAGRTDDGGVDNGAAVHQKPCAVQAFAHVGEYLFRQIVFFHQVTEVPQGGGIRDVFIREVHPHETFHGVAVVNGILGALVGEVEPYLQQVHPKHLLQFPWWTAVALFRIVRLYKGAPVCPRNDGIHLGKELLALGDPFPVFVFRINE